VKPARFKYLVVESVDEAVSALVEYGHDAALLAGGQSLVPLMNMRMARPAVVIDVNRLTELDSIEQAGGRLTIGALTRQARAGGSSEVSEASPTLAEAILHIGHPAIRSRGTVGGNVAHADASSELPAVLVALGGEVVARGLGGERTIAAEDMFITHFTTALDRELLTHVRVPRDGDGVRTAFLEVARRHGDFALVGAAVRLRLAGDGTCAEARIALSGVSGAPFRPARAEEALVGRRPDDEHALADVRRLVSEDVAPTADVHATAEYRKRVAGALVRRAIEKAVSR
jgi:carbon-monoxide dehydrogenase medium subunit